MLKMMESVSNLFIVGSGTQQKPLTSRREGKPAAEQSKVGLNHPGLTATSTVAAEENTEIQARTFQEQSGFSYPFKLYSQL